MRLVRRFQPDDSTPWEALFLGPAVFGLVFEVGRLLFKLPGLFVSVREPIQAAATFILLLAAFQSSHRFLIRSIYWMVRRLSTERILEGSVGQTVAERKWQRRDVDDNRPRELEPEARYRFVFLGDGGEEYLCEVPSWIWKNLQEGDRVRLGVQGLDLFEVIETEDRNGR